MIALILKDGTLEPVGCELAEYNHIRVAREMLFELPRNVELTPAQRRKAARRFAGRGRRRARPVPQRDYDLRRSVRAPDIDTYKAHLLSDGRRDVRLFLLNGQDVTDEICRDVERWLARTSAR